MIGQLSQNVKQQIIQLQQQLIISLGADVAAATSSSVVVDSALQNKPPQLTAQQQHTSDIPKNLTGLQVDDGDVSVSRLRQWRRRMEEVIGLDTCTPSRCRS